MSENGKRTSTSEPRTSVRADLCGIVGQTELRKSHPFLRTWFLCFLAAAALYISTANRGAQWQDCGYFILRSVTGESVNPLGIALTHPLHYWLSRVALALNLVEPAFAVTLISSIAAAITIANVLGCVWSLTGSRPAATLAAATLAVANTFWQLAAVAEVYTLTTALLSAECWCLVAFLKSANQVPETPPKMPSQQPSAGISPTGFWAFCGMWFFNGLGLSNHNLALLTLPALSVATLWAIKLKIASPKLLIAGSALWTVGASLFLQLVLQQGLHTGDWPATIQSALFGHSYGKDVLSTSISLGRLLISAGFIFLNFPNLFLPVAAIGLWVALSVRTLRFLFVPLLTGLLVNIIFAARYPVVDQHHFFLASYVLLTLFAGVGFARLLNGPATAIVFHQRARSSRAFLIAATLIVLTPPSYLLVPVMARKFGVLKYVERNKPYRDDYAYLFFPWSVTETSADRMSRQAAELAGDNGTIIVEDRMAEFAIRYQLVRTARPGVQVTREMDAKRFVELTEKSVPIVLVPQNADHPATLPILGSWRRTGDLYIFEPE